MQFRLQILLALSCLTKLFQAAILQNINQSELSPRIVNGMTAKLGQFPYQVLLRPKQGKVCGGSIISQNFVLTAAHCIEVRKPPSDYDILAGTVNFNWSSVIVPIEQFILHPNYKKFINDIALLKLAKPLNFSETIKAIPLQTEEIKNGEFVTISGWGRLYNGGPLSARLQYTKARALSNDECSMRIRNVFGDAPPTMLCLEPINGSGGCHGDSGGPAVYHGKLAGVTNFGLDGCGGTLPMGYSKVYAHLDFIRKNSDVN